MYNEFELKVIDIKPDEVRRRLSEIGAKFIAKHHYRRLMVRLKEGKPTRWMRIRTDGKTSTMTMKERYGRGIEQTYEYEIEISDFAKAAKILGRLFKNIIYEENTREEYRIGNATITIDKWPGIPPFMEIEGRDKKSVVNLFKRLGVSGKEFGNVPASEVYKHYGLDFVEVAKKNERKLKKLVE